MAMRRNRYLALAAILAVLVVLYVLTGASSTRNSAFYKKTVEQMQSSHAGDIEDPTAPHEPARRWPNIADPGDANPESIRRALRHSKQDDPSSAEEADEPVPEVTAVPEKTLRERLRDAERSAKKSADDRYRALRDIEVEVTRDREARGGASSSSSVAEASSTSEVPRTSVSASSSKAQETASELSIAGRIKVPAAPADSDLAKLRGAEYQSPLTPQPGETQEERELREVYAEIIASSPVVIFSKTYCPFSKKAKRILLEHYNVTPRPRVVELDEHSLGGELQTMLLKITGRRTVPNILVNGKTMGGGDEVEMLWKSGEMPARLRQMSYGRVEKVVEVTPFQAQKKHS